LFGVARRVFLKCGMLNAECGTKGERGAAWLAFAVALVWAVHPLQTAAVTYVVQRAESLAGLFYLLTLYCFIRAIDGAAASLPPDAPQRAQPGGGTPPLRRAVSRWWGAAAVAACALGMGTKETVATAPLVALLMDRAFFAGSFREAWRRRGRLYIGLAAAWLLLAALVLSNAGRGGSAGLGSEVGAWAYLLTQCGAVTRYLGLAVWPASQVFDYGTPVVAGLGAVWWQALLLCALAAGTLRGLWRNRAAGFLGAWFFLMLAPSSSFVPVSTQTIAEHRMYLALAAVAALVCAGAWRALARLRDMKRKRDNNSAPAPASSQPFSPSALQPLFLTALACAVAALGAATVARNAVWRTAESLWADTVEKRPDNPRARNNLGAALLAEGRAVEAAAQFRRAIALRPNHAFAHLNLGVALMVDPRAALGGEAAGRWNGAAADGGASGGLQSGAGIPPAPGTEAGRADSAALRAEAARQATGHFRAALAAEPGNTSARVNLGKLLADAGRTAEAMEQYRAALAGDPAAQDARVNLAALLASAGREAEGAALLREALAAEPGLAEAHYHLGLLLEKSGARREAESEFRDAARLKPDMAAAHLALGNCLARRGDAGAEACYREALRLDSRPAGAWHALGNVAANQGQSDPRLAAEAWYALGNVFAKQERFDGAMDAYRKALELDPSHAQALNNLGNCQLVTGRAREAVATYEEVLRRRPGDATVRQNLDYARELAGAR
jgi:tetratricopeptide (TPR) repeat protein